MSDKPKHTPGPWNFNPGTSPHYQGLISAEVTGANIAVTYNDEGAPNACLIAAAPKMLAALKTAVAGLKGEIDADQALNEIEAVIAEAREVEVDSVALSHMFALVSSQGTACSETALCGDHYTLAHRKEVEEAVGKDKSAADAPLLGSWRDCSGNEVLVCVVC